MAQPDLRPLDYGEVLDRAFVLYRRNFRLTLAFSFPVLFPSALVVGLANIGYQWALRTQLASSNTTSAQMIMGTLAITAFFGATGLHGLLSLWVQTMLASAGSRLYLGEPVKVRDVYGRGLRQAVIVILTTMIVTLGVTFGMVFFLVPGIILSVYWAFIVQTVVVEDTSFFEAMSRSWRLVQGSWWHAAVFVVLLGLLVWILELIIVAPVQVLTIVEVISHPEAIYSGATPNILALAAQGLLGAVATSLLAPLGAYAMTLFYFDLRARKEGFDLVVRARRMMPAGSPAE